MQADILTLTLGQRKPRRLPITLGNEPDDVGYFGAGNDYGDPTLDPAYVDPNYQQDYYPTGGGYTPLPNSAPTPIRVTVNAPRSASSGPTNLDSILKAVETGLVAFAKPGNAYPASSALRSTPVASGQIVNAAGQVINPATGLGAGVGSVAGGMFDSIALLIKQHPLATLIVGGGTALLFMKPPTRGR